ncbi:hypothetical protein BDQ94DRAFT_184879 [Aspergillus welwitschiae]|uniref:F-box domain-containing protein n=1 Tax=Aspergillus welwitschiae TaxID=1341132 RepID=A0A3F3QD78_9EURO|nr:hypothetical protein BDQ94DRAFT_184879 [Aspergillus welwitschiae]RDH36792.1 hypothetical protein BDQ94DRAFT_184879 [Aspergillus welwitschiae]
MKRWFIFSETAYRSDGDIATVCPLLGLPPELLLQIVSYLSIIEEICLFMTCKQLYAAYGPISKPESVQVHRPAAAIPQSFYNYTSVALRWKLLRYLENDRWQACFRCLVLHPPASFPMQKEDFEHEELLCSLGLLAGIVEICPCKKLTFHETMGLRETLRTRQRSLGALSTQLAPGSLERFCWHSCTHHSGSTQLAIAVFPRLESEDQLIIKTEYQLSITQEHPGVEPLTPYQACAHRYLDSWLASVCQRTPYGLPDRHCTPCSRIFRCEFCNTTLKCLHVWPRGKVDRQGKRTYLFYTERNLGRASSFPDKIWAAQRSHPLLTEAR